MSLTGPAGIVEYDGSMKFRVHPAFCVLQRLCVPAEVCAVNVSDPTKVAALALMRGDARELLLANLTVEAVDVSVRVFPSDRVETLSHGSTIADASFGWTVRHADIGSALRLDAYEVVVVQ